MSTYCALMEDIKARIAVIRRFTHGEVSLGRDDIDAEALCIQFRKILEAVAFGSLVAHRQAYEQAHADIETRWRAKEILARIEAIHPKFYPQPHEPQRRDGKIHMEPIARPFLTRDDFVTLYDKCGDMLHQWNPFRPGARHIDFGRGLDEWCDLIQNLVRHHIIWMRTDVEPGEGWFVDIHSPEDGKAHALLFASAEPET